jgi:hypothetical protein
MNFLERVIAQLEEELKPNIGEGQRKEFYDMGLLAMEAYLREHPVGAEEIDTIIDLVGQYLDENDDIETAIFDAVTNYIINDGQWKTLAFSDWFDNEVMPTVEEAVGYEAHVDEEGIAQMHPPAGLRDMQKQQLEINVEALQEFVLDGLQTAEEYYLEDIVFNKLEDLIPKVDVGIPVEMPLELEREYATV